MADQQQLGAPPSQQQQQHQPQQQHGNVLTPAAQGGNGDSTVLCQWQACGLRFPTAELVYDHLCEQHIGRKSTNNLNLTCAWNTCHIQLQKRDHMTSHVRVHVPLKPHHCSFCGKSFKRPQDLKKHVKTHADDTVTRASMNSGGNVQHQNGAYNTGPQNRMPNYYGGGAMQPGAPMNYGQQNNNNGSSAYYTPTQQASQPTYGYVNYDVNQSTEVGNQASFGSRKRGYDAIDNFLGDAKRGRINLSDYVGMSSRLSSLQGIQLPMPAYGGVGTMAGDSYANYQAAPVMMDVGGNSGGVYGPTSQQPYSLPPMSNLRTKDDLLETQDVIGRIMTSLYEHPNTTASVGAPTNGSYMYTGVADRQSHSPPGLQLPRSHNGSISSAPDMMATASNHSSTPALTPSSYHSGTSPVSMQSNHSMSPHSTAAMYPNLPSAASTSEANGYMTSNMAPTSTLGNQFDYDNRQRYGGGRLQKAAPPPRSIDDKIDASKDHVATAKKALSTSSEEMETPKSDGRPLSRLSNSAIDPALSGLMSPSAMSESETVADKAQEVWVENVRLVEFLKKVVDRMLEEGEYEGGGSDKVETRDEENSSLYPTLREMAVSG